MDTYNIEMSILDDEYKLSMLTLEHENFTNIIRNNISLNEETLHEGIIHPISTFISNARKIIKILKEKVMKFINWIKEKIRFKKVEKHNQYSMKKFDNLLPDSIINVPDVNNLSKVKKELDDNTEEIKDYINKIKSIANGSISYENYEKYYKDIDNLNYDLNNRYLELTTSIQNGYFDTEYKKIKGSELSKNEYVKFLALDDDVSESQYYDLGKKLIKLLDDADKYVGNIGKKYTYEDRGYSNRYHISPNHNTRPEEIKTDSYDKSDAHYDDEFIKMMNMYINCYATIFKYINTNCNMIFLKLRKPLLYFMNDIYKSSDID